jgi:hypothetical protein
VSEDVSADLGNGDSTVDLSVPGDEQADLPDRCEGILVAGSLGGTGLYAAIQEHDQEVFGSMFA